jgi:hypothetical protein
MMRRESGVLRSALPFALLTLVLAAVPVEGQWRDLNEDRRSNDRGPSAYVGFGFVAANPVGEFGRNVDDGFGLALEGRFPVSATDGVFSLRLDGGFMIYGNETRGMCFPAPVGCRIGVDLNTYNTIAYVGVGPELAGPGPVSPYINGSVGLTWFVTNSSLSGDDDWDSNFNTTNYSDWVTALRAGAGVRLRIGGSANRPVLLDLGAQYHRNGVADYLREGDIVDYADGSIELFPIRSEANLMTFNVGVSFGVGGRGDSDRDARDDDHPGHRRR